MKRTPLAAQPPIDIDDYAADVDDGNKYKKGIETRDQIFSEATDLFYEKGYADTSIRQLINKVGKSSSVIYNHFADKEDILFIITRRTGEKTLAMLAKIRQRHSDPEACLKAMVAAMVHLVSHPSMVKEIAIFRNEAHHLPARKRKIISQQHLGIVHQFEDVVVQIAKKSGRGTVNSKVAAFNILAIINWFYMWYQKEGKLSCDAICDEILQFIFHGIE